jgi:hypothetical protein
MASGCATTTAKGAWVTSYNPAIRVPISGMRQELPSLPSRSLLDQFGNANCPMDDRLTWRVQSYLAFVCVQSGLMWREIQIVVCPFGKKTDQPYRRSDALELETSRLTIPARPPSLLLDLLVNEQTSHARQRSVRRGWPDAYSTSWVGFMPRARMASRQRGARCAKGR